MMSVPAKEDQPAGGEVTVTIDEMLCCALYTASRAATDIYRPILEELGLTDHMTTAS